LILLLLVSFAAAADDLDWFQKVGEAASKNTASQNSTTDCNAWCLEKYGPQWTPGVWSKGCTCIYNPGSKKDDSSPVYVPTKDTCDQECKKYQTSRIYGANASGISIQGFCRCTCKDGYVPNNKMECISEEDAAWESFQDKCRDLREFTKGGGDTFTVTQQELIYYLKKVEKANSGSSWKQIVAALHVNRYNDDALSKKLPILGTPLFEWGPETDGWQDVDLLCRAPLGSLSNPPWYTPKFVRRDDGVITELGHAYGAVRINLNRESSVNGTFLNRDQWTQIITHWGDYWQVLSEGDHKKLPPDQYLGNEMGIWLEKYYRQNPDAPLSESFQAYFNSKPYLDKRQESWVWTVGEFDDKLSTIRTFIPFIPKLSL